MRQAFLNICNRFSNRYSNSVVADVMQLLISIHYRALRIDAVFIKQ